MKTRYSSSELKVHNALVIKAEAGKAVPGRVPGRSVGRNTFVLSAQMMMKKEEVIAIIRANLYDYDEPAQHFEWAQTDDVRLSGGPSLGPCRREKNDL